jgi:hypothetical protein
MIAMIGDAWLQCYFDQVTPRQSISPLRGLKNATWV